MSNDSSKSFFAECIIDALVASPLCLRTVKGLHAAHIMGEGSGVEVPEQSAGIFCSWRFPWYAQNLSDAV